MMLVVLVVLRTALLQVSGSGGEALSVFQQPAFGVVICKSRQDDDAGDDDGVVMVESACVPATGRGCILLAFC